MRPELYRTATWRYIVPNSNHKLQFAYMDMHLYQIQTISNLPTWSHGDAFVPNSNHLQFAYNLYQIQNHLQFAYMEMHLY